MDSKEAALQQTLPVQRSLQTPKAKSEGAPLSTAFSKPCLFCEKNHTLETCRFIRDKPHKDRVEFLRKSELCFSCLVKGHLSKDCKRKMSCQVCFQRHPSFLHSTRAEDSHTGKSSNDETEPQTVSSALVSVHKENGTSTGAGGGDSILATVPVIETYAFMDPGRSSTFCTEDLARQLNLTGRKTKIFLTTMNQSGFVDSHLLTDLEVGGLE